MSIIRIDQALYGYDEGHHAIAWSFPAYTTRGYREAPRPVALAERSSDLTGYIPYGTRTDTWHSRGFPLDPWYVLMRTWYDVGGPRAGCCWTHALFLPIAATATLFDYLTLGHLFRRPTRGEYDAYRTPIDITWPPEKDKPAELPAGQRAPYAGEFARITKRNPDEPCIWSGEETAEAFCSYMWRFHFTAERRANFAFHSGAVDMVWYGKRPYDVVCMAAPSHLQQGSFYHQRANIIGPATFR